jgi:chromosome segregation ATPase
MKPTRSSPFAIIIALGFAAAVCLLAETAPPAKPDSIATMQKAIDDANAKAATAQAQLQQTQLAAEYYKASSERDQAILRLVNIQQQLEQTQRELQAARDEIATLKKPADPKK